MDTITSEQTYEGELALVIGKGGRRVRDADAWEHVAGVACFNESSVRDRKSKDVCAVPHTGGQVPLSVGLRVFT